MADVNETLADISAELRRMAEAQYEAWANDPSDAPDGRYWSSFLAKLADRIDAAAKRETVASSETQSTIHNEPCECQTAHNAAAMCEALERFADVPDEDLCELEKHAREMQDHCVYGGGALEGIILRVRIAKDALAAPPRNCDRPEIKTLADAIAAASKEIRKPQELHDAAYSPDMFVAAWLLAEGRRKEGGEA